MATTASHPVTTHATQHRHGYHEHHAATAAHYVIHSKRITRQGDRIDAYSAYVTPKTVPATEPDFASAGAAANLAYAHRYQSTANRHGGRLAALDRQQRPVKTKSRLSTASSKAAFLSAQDEAAEAEEARSVVGSFPPALQEEYLEDEPDAKAAAASALSGVYRSSSEPYYRGVPPGYSGPAVSAATTSHHRVVREAGGTPLEQQRRGRGATWSGRAPTSLDYEKEREDARRAEAVVMAQQMYALMPQAEEIAAAEIENEPSDGRPSRRTMIMEGERPRQRTADMHAIAERRAAEQMARLDSGQRPASVTGAPVSHRRYLLRRWSSAAESEDSATMRRVSTRKPFQSFREEPEEEPEPVDTPLMAAAKRKKELTMKQIDEDIYARSGKPTPAKMEEWETRAHERKRETREGQLTTTFVPGRERQFEDQRDLEEVARQRLKPTFADIDSRVNKARNRDLAAQLDQAHYERWLQWQREREAEVARVEREIERSKYADSKKSAKQFRDAEKARIKAEKKAAKAQKKAAGKERKKGREAAAAAGEPRHTEEEQVSPLPSETARPEQVVQEDQRSDMPQRPTTEREPQHEVPAAPMGQPYGERVARPLSPGERVQKAPEGIAEAEQMDSETLPAAGPDTKAAKPQYKTRKAARSPSGETPYRSWLGRSRSAHEPRSPKASEASQAHAHAAEPTGGIASAAAAGPVEPAAAPRLSAEKREPERPQVAVPEAAATATEPTGASTTIPAAQPPAEGATTVKTTTVSRQKRTWRTFFTRSPPARNTAGTQGSFDAQHMMTGRNIGGSRNARDEQHAAEPAPTAAGDEASSTPAPSVGRFQEVL
ncbi:hypothetical protein VTO42DRAFT_3950 [Malbranchea cinnamomea]